ncbi:MAG: hypothetical protein ACKO38_14340, partial [Planctomycetota bacterium]
MGYKNCFAAGDSLTPTPATEKGPRVTIVVGPQAPAIERFAADELSELLRKLFSVEVTIAAAAPAISDPGTASPALIFLGSPATNPAVAVVGGRLNSAIQEGGHHHQQQGLSDERSTLNHIEISTDIANQAKQRS